MKFDEDGNPGPTPAQTTLTGSDFPENHKTARKISLRFTFFKPGKKVHLAALILKVRAWDQFARLNVNGMKIVFLFKLFLKIKV